MSENTPSKASSTSAPVAGSAANDVSMASSNVKAYTPANTISDVANTMSNAVREAYGDLNKNAANHRHNVEPDLAEVVDAAVEANPVRKQLATRIKHDADALNLATNVLQKLFSNAKLMHMPPDAIQAIVSNVYAHVAEYQTHKEQNPTIDIAYLQQKIDTGSHFFHEAHQTILEHHPEHENYMDDLGEGGGTSGHDHHHKDKKARLRHAQARVVHPTEHAAATTKDRDAALSEENIDEHTQNIQDKHLGATPKTVVGNVQHHGIVETLLHFVGLH